MKFVDCLIQQCRIRKVVPYLKVGMRVLDIGCADGALFRLVPDLLDGVGIDPNLTERSNVGSNVLLPGMFPEALPDNRPFDAVTLLAVLEHMPPAPQERLAHDINRSLAAGGHLLITVPSPAADRVLTVLKTLRLIHGMSLEQHYGYRVEQTPALFRAAGLVLVARSRFQLGLNNLFIFRKPTVER